MNRKIDKFTGQYRESDEYHKDILNDVINISGDSWNNQASNWTTVGTPPSYTFANNKMTIAEGIGKTLADRIAYTLRSSSLRRRKIRIKYQITSAISSTSKGLIFGLTPIGDTSFTNYPIQWQLNCSTNATYGQQGCIWYKLTNSVEASYNYGFNGVKLPIAQNDIIECIFTMSTHSIHIEWKNLTQNKSTSLLYRYDTGGYTMYPVNFSQFSICNYGGTYDILELQETALELKQLDLLFIGDSISTAVGTTKCGRNFPEIVQSRFSKYSISQYSGPGDSCNRYVTPYTLNEIVSLAPKTVFMLLGSNDLAHGRTEGQLETDYSTMITAFKNAGIEVIHGGLIPRAGTDVRTFNTFIRTTYPNDLICDLYSLLAITGTQLDGSGSTYAMSSSYTADGTHMNDVGNLMVADVITSFLIRENVFTANNASSAVA